MILKARAIENQAYVVAVNRLGVDGNNISYAGDSCVINFRGEVILDLGQKDEIGDCELEHTHLQKFRHDFPAHLDADSFDILFDM